MLNNLRQYTNDITIKQVILLNTSNNPMRKVLEVILFLAAIVVLSISMIVSFDYVGMGFPDIFIPMLVCMFSLGFVLYAGSLVLHFAHNHSYPINQYFFVMILPVISVLGQISVSIIWLINQVPCLVPWYLLTTEESFQSMCIFLMIEVLSLPLMIHVVAWNLRPHRDYSRERSKLKNVGI